MRGERECVAAFACDQRVDELIAAAVAAFDSAAFAPIARNASPARRMPASSCARDSRQQLRFGNVRRDER